MYDFENWEVHDERVYENGRKLTGPELFEHRLEYEHRLPEYQKAAEQFGQRAARRKFGMQKLEREVQRYLKAKRQSNREVEFAAQYVDANAGSSLPSLEDVSQEWTRDLIWAYRQFGNVVLKDGDDPEIDFTRATELAPSATAIWMVRQGATDSKTFWAQLHKSLKVADRREESGGEEDVGYSTEVDLARIRDQLRQISRHYKEREQPQAVDVATIGVEA